MKRARIAIVALGLLSSMLVNTAYAGNHRGGGIDPFWIPVAILSTAIAVATIAQQPEPPFYREPCKPSQTIIVEEPRHAGRYYGRGHAHHDSDYVPSYHPRRW